MKHNSAYTLIELLVVISVTIIVFGVGVAGYREFSRRQALTGIIKQIKADLRLTQQLALTGQKPEGVVCPQLSSYTFSRIGANNYRLIANCDGVASIIYKDVFLPENTTISAGNINFKVLGQGTNLVAPHIFTVANTVSGTSGSISVGIGGDIQ